MIRRSIDRSEIDLVLQRPGHADASDLTSPTVVLIKEKPRSDKRSWAAFLAPRPVRRCVRVFHHDTSWELRAEDGPLDANELAVLLYEAEAIRIAPSAREERRSKSGATFTLKIRTPQSNASTRYRWVGRGPSQWAELIEWAERFRRLMEPPPAQAIEADYARLEELERNASELDDDFKRRSIAEHVVEWRRELTRLGAAFESGAPIVTGANEVDPVARLRKVSSQIDQLYDVMKVEERKRGAASWPPRPPG